MITAVTLRLVYVIFQQVLGLVLLTGRAASSKDVELLVPRHEVANLRRTNPRPRLDHAWTTPGPGRPGRPRRFDPEPADDAARPPPAHPGNGPALVPAPRAQKVDLPEPARTPTAR
jgi:hypothetical protein